ncbi:MAG: DMT family transporter [Archangiaceae bacterium]|nr:DMT family transporter [Archangiaceae bacterium]
MKRLASASALVADSALLGITVFWGVSFALVKDALDDADPFTFLALRFSVAAVASAALVRGGLKDRTLWRPAGWLAIFLFGGFITQTWGLATTTPSRSAFITSLFVMFVPLCEWLLFKKRPAASAFVGSALAIAGTYVLSGASFGGGLSLGDWVTVGCAALFSVHIVLTGHWAKDRDPGGLVAAQMLLVAALAWLAVPFGPMRLTLSLAFAARVLATGTIGTALGLSVQTWAQSRTTAVRAALILALEPVFAAAWSMGSGREPYDPRVLQGGALMLVGVLVAEVFKGRGPAPRHA